MIAANHSSCTSQKAADLVKVKNDILKVDIKQVKYQLLTQCFAQKLIYIQRNIAPGKLTSLLQVFENCKRSLLEDIVESPLDDKRFQLSLLAIDESGLGLLDSRMVSHAAFVASKAEFYAEKNDLFTDFFFFLYGVIKLKQKRKTQTKLNNQANHN
jgi:hypothetical protein